MAGWSTVTTADLTRILTGVEGNITIGAGTDDQYTVANAEAFITDIENEAKLKLSNMYDPATLDGAADTILKAIIIRIVCYELYVGAYPEGENPSLALLTWQKKYNKLLDMIATPSEKGALFLTSATLTTFGAAKKSLYTETGTISSCAGSDTEKVFDIDLSEEPYIEAEDA